MYNWNNYETNFTKIRNTDYKHFLEGILAKKAQIIMNDKIKLFLHNFDIYRYL